MILTYNKGEFVVNNVEIRKIICEPYYEYDYSLYPTCDISEMEAYINGVQIDIEDELLISNNDWNIIREKVCERISEKDYISYTFTKKEKPNKSELVEKLSKLFPNICN